MIVTLFGCTAIYNKSLYKCIIHEHTHPEQWAAIYAAAPGEQLGV